MSTRFICDKCTINKNIEEIEESFLWKANVCRSCFYSWHIDLEILKFFGSNKKTIYDFAYAARGKKRKALHLIANSAKTGKLSELIAGLTGSIRETGCITKIDALERMLTISPAIDHKVFYYINKMYMHILLQYNIDVEDDFYFPLIQEFYKTNLCFSGEHTYRTACFLANIFIYNGRQGRKKITTKNKQQKAEKWLNDYRKNIS